MTTAPILDLATVQEAKDTMKAKFATMLQYYLEDSESYIAAIREGIAANSSEKIVSPAHTLKSSSRQMGAAKLSDIAKTIEILARDQSSSGKNDMPPFQELLSQLDTAFGETKKDYKTVI